MDIEPGKSGKPNSGSTHGLMARCYQEWCPDQPISKVKNKMDLIGVQSAWHGECEVRDQLRAEREAHVDRVLNELSPLLLYMFPNRRSG